MQHKRQQIVCVTPGRTLFARGVACLVAYAMALLFVMGGICPASVAWAEDEPVAKAASVQVGVPFSSGYSGNPTDATLTYVLEALDPANPLPPQAQNSQAVIVVTPGGLGLFEKLTFNQPGEYVYALSQQPGADPSATYDATVFKVCVTVLYNNDNELSSVLWFAKEGVSGKLDQARFENAYTTSGGGGDPGDFGDGGKDVFELPTPFGPLPLTGDNVRILAIAATCVMLAVVLLVATAMKRHRARREAQLS